MNVGLKLARVVTLEDWRVTGRELMGTVGALPWWLGDWYLCGVELARAELQRGAGSKFGELGSGLSAAREHARPAGNSELGTPNLEPTHMELAAMVRRMFSAGDRAWKTAQNAAVVCRAFGPSRRREGLSYSHHESLAALPVKEQERWLNRAEEGEWSTADLREAVRGEKQGLGRCLNLPRQYILSAHVTKMLRWLKAQDLAADAARRQAIAQELAPLVEFAEGLKREM